MGDAVPAASPGKLPARLAPSSGLVRVALQNAGPFTTGDGEEVPVRSGRGRAIRKVSRIAAYSFVLVAVHIGGDDERGLGRAPRASSRGQPRESPNAAKRRCRGPAGVAVGDDGLPPRPRGPGIASSPHSATPWAFLLLAAAPVPPHARRHRQCDGDEYQGYEYSGDLRLLDPDQMNGDLLAVPVVNGPAFWSVMRTSRSMAPIGSHISRRCRRYGVAADRLALGARGNSARRFFISTSTAATFVTACPVWLGCRG